ncbi:MAG: type II toxin-antitoxin system Phd/YefM family antitoxin [candidate division NC10 bacterium]|nr:type II toxin-antitoxin system Phd/YefM family antitoxin [candidate division NC10 bacterium]
MVKRMSAKEARERFAELLGQVHYGKDTVIVEKQGKPVAAVISMEEYKRFTEARTEPFRVLDRIWARNRSADPAQVQADVDAARAEVRGRSRGKARRRA